MHFNLPVPGTTTEITPWKAYDLTASGRQFGIHQARDEGRFACVVLEGDFDVWCRIELVANEAGNIANAEEDANFRPVARARFCDIHGLAPTAPAAKPAASVEAGRVA